MRCCQRKYEKECAVDSEDNMREKNSRSSRKHLCPLGKRHQGNCFVLLTLRPGASIVAFHYRDEDKGIHQRWLSRKSLFLTVSRGQHNSPTLFTPDLWLCEENKTPLRISHEVLDFSGRAAGPNLSINALIRLSRNSRPPRSHR